MQGLSLQDLVIRRDGAVLIALNRTIAAGEVLTVMGPSGAGKSTLLAAITGTLAPGFVQTGRIALNGTDVTALPPEARRIGILFQDDLLFPHLSVGENLAFGLAKGRGTDAPGGQIAGRAARRARIDAALAAIGMEGFYGRDPATLSGGQRARVALMRMLLSHPQALLLDEAFARLDTALRAQMRDLVFSTARARALPVVQVTHDMADAEAAGGPIVTIGPSEGAAINH